MSCRSDVVCSVRQCKGTAVFFRFQEKSRILLSLVATTAPTGDISGKCPQNLSHTRDSPCCDRVTSSPPEFLAEPSGKAERGGEPVRAGWSALGFAACYHRDARTSAPSALTHTRDNPCCDTKAQRLYVPLRFVALQK